MIRYDISLEKLREEIKEENKSWLSRAERRTDKFIQQGFYEESGPIWSEVKAVYIRLQEDKCVFCEKSLEGDELGKNEYDLEHFRPKKNVRRWEPVSPTEETIPMTEPPAEGGYYKLAYHPFNYAASCKPCNSVLKKDYFPIAGTYNLESQEPDQLVKSEKPYLIYPLGALDTDPETLIAFYGVFPRPVAGTGYARHRALIMIEFFELDNVTMRKQLIKGRAMIILALYPQLKMSVEGTPEEKNKAQLLVKGFTKKSAVHANCSRSFKKLFTSNPQDAKALFEAVGSFYESVS